LTQIKESAPPEINIKLYPRQGTHMTSQLELSARAALCRQFARREPNSKVYWLAEAENWLRISREPIHQVRMSDRDPFEQFPGLMDKWLGPS
jgi:hypothetical protein